MDRLLCASCVRPAPEAWRASARLRNGPKPALSPHELARLALCDGYTVLRSRGDLAFGGATGGRGRKKDSQGGTGAAARRSGAQETEAIARRRRSSCGVSPRLNALEAVTTRDRDVHDLAEFGRAALVACGEQGLRRLVRREHLFRERICERFDEVGLVPPARSRPGQGSSATYRAAECLNLCPEFRRARHELRVASHQHARMVLVPTQCHLQQGCGDVRQVALFPFPGPGLGHA